MARPETLDLTDLLQLVHHLRHRDPDDPHRLERLDVITLSNGSRPFRAHCACGVVAYGATALTAVNDHGYHADAFPDWG